MFFLTNFSVFFQLWMRWYDFQRQSKVLNCLVKTVKLFFQISTEMMLCYPCHSYIDENIYSDSEMYSD